MIISSHRDSPLLLFSYFALICSNEAATIPNSPPAHKERSNSKACHVGRKSYCKSVGICI